MLMSFARSPHRDDPMPLSEQAGGHPVSSRGFAPVLSSTSNDGARTVSAANMASLVPPAMRTRTAVTALERRCSDTSSSSSSSRRRKRHTALLPLAGKGSADSCDLAASYRSQSPPRHSPSKLCPPSSEHRRGSSLSDISNSTVEEESHTTPPEIPFTAAGHRNVTASDYAPLPETAVEPQERVEATLPKLARPRFGHEPSISNEPDTEKGAPPLMVTPTGRGASGAALSEDERVHTPPPSVGNAACASTLPQEPASKEVAPQHSASASSSPSSPSFANTAPASLLQPLQPRHGAAPALPPIAPRSLRRHNSAEAAPEDTGFMPLPEIPRATPPLPPTTPPKRAGTAANSRTATPERGQAANRPRSARRPTQSVQTARARAQQRRTAASSSPHSRGTPVAPQSEFFPGAKRLDDDRLPLSTKLLLGTACVVGVALVFYLGRSVYRYASVNIMESNAASQGPSSKFARARISKKAVVTEKEAAKIARDIRDRIVGNMQNAIEPKTS